MSIVVGYVRVSTQTQVAEGEGLAVQRDKIGAWCGYQGVALTVVEEDAGISGATTDNRPAFKRAMRTVLEAGKGATLVVYKLDRLGRNALDVQEALAVLLDAGVRVVAIKDGVDSASGMGAALLKLLTSILSTFAELEKDSIKTRLQDGRQRAKAQGRTYASEPAYGQRRADGDALEADPGELVAVERIRALRARGLSLRAIGASLIEEGITPRRAATWSPAVILRLATGSRTPVKAKASERITRARAGFLSA